MYSFQEKKWFVLDEELLADGCFKHCAINHGGLCFSPPSESMAFKGVYVAYGLDSGEKETQWGRLKIAGALEGDGAVVVSYFASDTGEISLGETRVSVDAFLQSTVWTVDEKIAAMDGLWVSQRLPLCRDMLLLEAKGRYLFLKIEVDVFDGSRPLIQQVQVEFSGEHLINQLPEFYRLKQNNPELMQRFLSIFQSVTDDLQESIEAISVHFNPNGVEKAHLHWLSRFMAVDNPHMWEEPQLRALIGRMYRLYLQKGTLAGIAEVVAFYTGAMPMLMEAAEILDFYQGSPYEEDFMQLFGTDVYAFFIFIHDRHIEGNKAIAEIGNLVEAFKPAHTFGHLVVLKPYMVLGDHTYLGVNSVVGGSAKFVMDDKTILPYHTQL